MQTDPQTPATASRSTPSAGSVSFDIYFPGEIGAGLRSFSDEVTVFCKSGQWGDGPGEFESYMQDCLKDWYDGAYVTQVLGERVARVLANSEVSGAGATASNEQPKSATRQRSLD